MVEKIVETLLERGYYKTKAEAIRAGILELGREYALIGREAVLVAKRISEMEEDVKEGKHRYVPIEETARKAGVKI
jgi:Arc/MetJ-type ribon-helix-helix transcriptional regulator